jgi:hypothetical protein
VNKSDANRESTMKVALRLVTGLGVEHNSKPGEPFLKGHKLSPQDDLEAMRKQAAEWLPFQKGPDCLDKSHGWKINHPLQKLIDYKNHILLGLPEGGDKKASRKRKALEPDPMDVLKKLKAAVDDGFITQQDFDEKKAEILARI